MGLKTTAPLTCMEWKEFEKKPELMYGLFQLAGGEGLNILHYDANEVTVLSTELIEDDPKKVFRVHNFEAFQAVKHKLTTRPIFMKVRVVFTYSDTHLMGKAHHCHKDEYALLVNPAHSMISAVLEAKFEEAAEQLANGNRFHIELNFNKVIGRWYENSIKEDPSMVYSNQGNCQFGQVFITNDVPSPYCTDLTSALCCPCRVLQRCLTRKDFLYSFSGVPVALRTELTSGESADILKGRNEDKVVIFGKYVSTSQPGMAITCL